MQCKVCNEETSSSDLYCSSFCLTRAGKERTHVAELVSDIPSKAYRVNVKDSNPKDTAASNRLDMTLFPDTAVAAGALAFTEGHFKYGGYNWREAGVLLSVYVAALKRHLAKYYNGEEADPNTGVPHLASVLACAAVLVDAKACGKLVDDRPPAVCMTGVLEEAEGSVNHLKCLLGPGPGRARENR